MLYSFGGKNNDYPSKSALSKGASFEVRKTKKINLRAFCSEIFRLMLYSIIVIIVAVIGVIAVIAQHKDAGYEADE